MLRIGIDINEANVQNKVGSNQYAFEIINALYQLASADQFTLYASAPVRPELPKPRKGWQYKVIPPAKLWTQWRLPLALLKDRAKLDVFYTPGHYAPRYSPIPTVVTVMDVAYRTHPEFFLKKDLLQLTSWTRYSVAKAAHVIAISQNTKQDVMKLYNRKSSDVTIAYPGFAPTHQSSIINLPAMLSKALQAGHKSFAFDYILFVGTIQPRKNLVRLIKAFEKLTSKHHLVLAGKAGWMADEVIAAIASSPKKNLIHQLGFVDEAELSALYRGSACTVMPGLYEGFGIPALEAIHHGAIPVVAKTGALPEVVGEQGLTFDPHSIDSISQTLSQAVQLTTVERENLLKSYRVHIKKFSWQTSAKTIMEVLRRVAIQR